MSFNLDIRLELKLACCTFSVPVITYITSMHPHEYPIKSNAHSIMPIFKVHIIAKENTSIAQIPYSAVRHIAEYFVFDDIFSVHKGL